MRKNVYEIHVWQYGDNNLVGESDCLTTVLFIFNLEQTTLLLLIFAELNFRDFKNIAKLQSVKTREKIFAKINHAKFNTLLTNSLMNVNLSLPHNYLVHVCYLRAAFHKYRPKSTFGGTSQKIDFAHTLLIGRP